MKKIILCLVFVFATGTSFLNANVSNNDTMINVKSTENVTDDFGCASDCVQAAKEGALLFSEDHENRGQGSELMENYTMLYTSCYDANCSN